MRGLSRFGSAALLLLVATSTAQSETLTLGGRTVMLDPPAGYCALDPARPEEAKLIDFNETMQQPRNHVAMQLADCGELEEFRAGKRPSFERYGQYFVPVTDGAVKPVPDYTRAQFLAEGARELPKLDSGALMDEVTAKLRESAGSDVAGAHFLGVLQQDAAGLYLGIAVGQVSVGDRTVSAGAIGVVGLTLVNRISVSLGLYQAHASAEAVPDLLAKIRQTLAATVQANAETEAREGAARGISLDPVLVYASIGGVIGAVIGVAIVARSRRRKHPPA
jgi:hypothetical protein